MNARQIHDNHRTGFNYLPLLGEDAQDATRPRPCGLCGYVIFTGIRMARIPGSDRWAHILCLASQSSPIR